MTSVVSDALSSKVIVGVEHRRTSTSTSMSRSQFSQHGTLLGDRAVSADSGGYAQLEVWAQELGRGLTGSESRAPAATALGSPG